MPLMIAVASANARENASNALLNNGYLRIYDGAQPVTADSALGAQVLLAELRFGSPAFGSAVAGVANANAITPDSDANATGTATWYRTYQSDGTTPVSCGTVGTSGANLNLNTVAIVQHSVVSVSAGVFTQPLS